VAYETAQDPTEWDSLQDKARKELEEEEENVDQLEDEEGEGEGETGGKRKRAAPEKGKSKKAKLEKKTKVRGREDLNDFAWASRGAGDDADGVTGGRTQIEAHCQTQG
jgi:hypothetical protein